MTQHTQKHYGEDVTIEQVKHLFFDEGALLLQPRPVYRMDHKGKRLYFTQDKEGNNTFYLSVTTFISWSLPTGPQLIKWYADNGYENAKEMAQTAADYGTMMHVEIGAMLIGGEYDLDKVSAMVKLYLQEVQQPPKLARKWAETLKKDMLAFAQFANDVNLKPLAIEPILADEEMGLAGAIDIVGWMDVTEKGFFGEKYKSGINAGNDKETKITRRVLAIVDMKSGRKGFYESSQLQLEAYKRIWNKNYPDKQVEKVFNWAPKEWRTSPSYTLKDQTGAVKAGKLEHLLEIAKIEASDREQMATIPGGMIVLANNNLAANIKVLTLDEIVKQSVTDLEVENAPDLPDTDFDKTLDLEENEG